LGQGQDKVFGDLIGAQRHGLFRGVCKKMLQFPANLFAEHARSLIELARQKVFGVIDRRLGRADVTRIKNGGEIGEKVRNDRARRKIRWENAAPVAERLGGSAQRREVGHDVVMCGGYCYRFRLFRHFYDLLEILAASSQGLYIIKYIN
jgi:hypothetical protein